MILSQELHIISLRIRIHGIVLSPFTMTQPLKQKEQKQKNDSMQKNRSIMVISVADVHYMIPL